MPAYLRAFHRDKNGFYPYAAFQGRVPSKGADQAASVTLVLVKLVFIGLSCISTVWAECFHTTSHCRGRIPIRGRRKTSLYPESQNGTSSVLSTYLGSGRPTEQYRESGECAKGLEIYEIVLNAFVRVREGPEGLTGIQAMISPEVKFLNINSARFFLNRQTFGLAAPFPTASLGWPIAPILQIGNFRLNRQTFGTKI